MKKDKFFSVIIPCYNSSSYVNNAINSIIKQGMDVEIIVVDDGSTDNLKSVIPDGIVYIKKDNGGVSSARNLGLTKSTGKYVLFLDSDDIFLDGLFDELKKIIKNQKPDMISWGFDIYKLNNTIDSRVSGKFYGNNNSKNILLSFLNKDIYQSICTICVKKELLVNNKIMFNEDFKYAEDLNFQIECMFLSLSHVYIQKPYFRYIHREGSAISAPYSLDRISVFELYEITRKKISDKNILNAFDRYVGLAFFQSIIHRFFRGEFNRDFALAYYDKIYLLYRVSVSIKNLKMASSIFVILSRKLISFSFKLYRGK